MTINYIAPLLPLICMCYYYFQYKETLAKLLKTKEQFWNLADFVSTEAIFTDQDGKYSGKYEENQVEQKWEEFYKLSKLN